MKKKAALHNLGCKVNAYETEAMQELLEQNGYEIVPFKEGADVYIINTCTVTNVADRKSRQMLHKARKMNPDAVVVATGCYVQARGEDIDPCVDIVVGNNKKKDLIAILDEYYNAQHKVKKELLDINHEKEYEEMQVTHTAEHTRAYIKVQDGCNQFCSYCIIPYARGRVRSLPVEQALEQTARLADAGVHEIVLTGIEIASYGKDFEPQVPLTELLEKLLTAQPNVQFRLGSLDPRAVDDAFCERLAGFANLARHFHLSMQSGCDTILRRMNRHYTSEEFYRCVERLRRAFPDCSVTTDLIVGFPGETEDEFAELCEFLQNVGIERVGVFEYSPEEGTEAAELPDQIDDETKQNRRLIVEELQSGVLDDYNTSRHGEVMQVLCEGFDEEQDLWYGRTYADSVEVDGHVYFDAADNEPAEGEFVSVLITESLGPDLLGVRQKEA